MGAQSQELTCVDSCPDSILLEQFKELAVQLVPAPLFVLHVCSPAVEDALRLGEKMDEGLFIWMEAPLDDEQVEQYAQLKTKLAVSIIPGGYTIYSPEFIRQGIQANAWDAGRFDATVVGGITQSLRLLMIANEADLPIEIQSWGHSLAQAANLHLILANERTQYFEAAMPKDAFEFGTKNGNLLDGGRVVAPTGPGLGIVVDWDHLAEADFYRQSEAVAPSDQ
jgi:L-alanine-DL-glutamate epimerase-like enolase superfamily enzyme